MRNSNRVVAILVAGFIAFLAYGFLHIYFSIAR